MARNIARRRRVVDDYEPPADDDTTTEEEPTRGRSRRRSAEPDDSGAEADEDAPRSQRASRRRVADDDADDEPRSRSRSRGDSDSGRGRSGGRSRSRDDDEDGGRGKVESTAGSGWSSWKSNKESLGEFAKNLKTEVDKEALVKILDAEPFYTYLEHWIDELKGRKSFVCLKKDNGCPLCQIGDRPTAYALFNVVDCTDPDNLNVRVWKCGTRNAGVLENYAKDAKSGPLDRDDIYYSILRTGSKSKGYQTTIKPVKARDVEEDWNMDPLTEEEIDSFMEERYEPDQAITVSTRKELREIADDLND